MSDDVDDLEALHWPTILRTAGAIFCLVACGGCIGAGIILSLPW